MIDFNKLHKEVTDCTNKETSESLREWLNNKRKEDMKTKLCRPVLVESKEEPNIGDLCKSPRYQNKVLIFGTFENSYQDECKKYQLILISLEDEKIEDSNEKYFESYNGMIKVITDKNVKSIGNYYNIVARQSQIPPEYISKFIEQYNSGCVKDVEIEMVDNGYEVDMEGIGGCEIGWMPKFEPKLINGFITIIEREPILYTEEELRIMCLESFKQGITFSHKGFSDVAYNRFRTWFEQNKKK